MRRTAGYVASLLALLMLTVAARAEVVTVRTLVSPLLEVPPITTLNASGGFVVTLDVTRDASGNITGGTATFVGAVMFPGAVTITGLHIHEQIAGVNGPIVIGTDISAGNPVVLASGVGIVQPPTVQNVSAAVLTRLLANPTGFYVNLHTSVNGGGAIRGQLVRTEETLSGTVALSPANEVPPITGLNATGTATVTINPKRNAQGAVSGGDVTFTVNFDGFPAGTIITGLHIHEQVAGVNGPIRIDTGITNVAGGNSVTTPTGRGMINLTAAVTADAAIMALSRLLANPAGFYVNLHTTVNPGGAIRGQLATLVAPPVIQQSNTYFLETGATDAQIGLLVTGIDLASTILVNGQQVPALLDITTGGLGVVIPAALRANAGTLLIQARNVQGLLSAPLTVVVVAAANVNTQVVTTTDAAKFGTLGAPEAIAVAFGTRLATSTVFATEGRPLATSLGGTSVYVNGVAAKLFFVSANQVNFLIPASTVPGPTAVVVVAGDGTVSRGTVNVAQSTPAIFTRLSTGLGAPAAVASADGAVFNINVSNADGTPVPLDAGNFVALFGTGLRFASGPVTMTVGGTPVTPLFVGAAPGFDGLDQVNLQIPASLAGRGEVDLIITAEGRTSNPVKLRIR